MPKWSGLTLTNLGKDLQVKCQTGIQLQFTRIKLGDGVHGDDESLAEQTELKSIKQVVGITECKVNQNNQCEISSVISNTGLEDGYYLRELGLYANDPVHGEILYAITLDSNPDFLPEDGGSVTLSETFNVIINIGNITDVTAIIDVGGWATTGYVGQQITIHDTDPNAHYDMAGASLTRDGMRGFVPKPEAGDPNRCLRADGSWGVPENTKYTNMEGASTTAAGKTGLVPPPRAGDNMSYLRGDGTWDRPSLLAYPIGAIYLSVTDVSPAAIFGGTWVQIKDRFLLTVGDTYREPKKTGGEASHKLTVNEMPRHDHKASSGKSGAHTHTGTASEAGEHKHTRGTMNITGSVTSNDSLNDSDYPEALTYADDINSTGALYVANKASVAGPNNISQTGGGAYRSICLDASKSWTGETSANGAHTHAVTTKSSGEHNHSVTIESSGNGAEHNNMPPYFTVYAWMRTA